MFLTQLVNTVERTSIDAPVYICQVRSALQSFQVFVCFSQKKYVQHFQKPEYESTEFEAAMSEVVPQKDNFDRYEKVCRSSHPDV